MSKFFQSLKILYGESFAALILFSTACDGKSFREGFNDKQEAAMDMITKVNTGFNDKQEAAMDMITEVNTGSGLKDLYEGDIVLDEDEKAIVDMSEEGDIDGQVIEAVTKRNAVRQQRKLWHDRIVPYEIASELSSYHDNIMRAFDEYHNKSCLKFVPRTTEKNWIIFVKENGCWSYIGRSYWLNDKQKVSLGNGCNNKGVIIHELMHALGFYHEQSRPDRNAYIEVFWENILDGRSHNFNKYSRTTLDVLGVQYDYQSIMHYGAKAFSKNGFPTIQVIGNDGVAIGQRNVLSVTDVIKVNSLYSCHLSGLGWSEWSSYSPCSSTCAKQRQRYCFSENAQHCPGVNEHRVATEIAICPAEQCHAPIDGHWGRWSAWSACSQTCGHGVKSRSRQCDDPPPKNNGQNCQGTATEKTDCSITLKCNLGPDDCEFPAGQYCGWVSNQLNPFYKWTTRTGPTPSFATGPNGDHSTSTGLGYYVYAEASYPATPGLKTSLTSKEFDFPPSQCRCMSWFYHMFGSGIGELSVFVEQNGQPKKTLWKRSGAQGNKWTLGEATISNISAANYKIQFESVRGVNYIADTAVDDIYFIEQPCGVISLGCYQDNYYYRVLPDLIATLRDKIDWSDHQKTIDECACIAYEKGYKYFSVQFYGECWGSKTSVDYDKYGAGSCVDGVGKNFSNFMYMFKN